MDPGAAAVHEDFRRGLGARWHRTVIGQGSLELTGYGLRLATIDAPPGRYVDAQIDDYGLLPRRRFPWRPPLTLTVRARFSPGSVLGTAGFGFWNDPWVSRGRWLTLPRALWFFYGSRPSNLKLDVVIPGWGFKAAAIGAGLPSVLLLAPAMPVAVPLMRFPSVYRALWPLAQRLLHIGEAELEVSMAEWHTYRIAWSRRGAWFDVDGVKVLDVRVAPRGPLGLVIWIDNQYMIATPWGRFAHGVLAAPGSQWLEIDTCRIEPGGQGFCDHSTGR